MTCIEVLAGDRVHVLGSRDWFLSSRTSASIAPDAELVKLFPLLTHFPSHEESRMKAVRA